MIEPYQAVGLIAPLQPVEHSMTPHNVWDRWVELHGAALDAFYPVADTEIGRRRTSISTASPTPTPSITSR